MISLILFLLLVIALLIRILVLKNADDDDDDDSAMLPALVETVEEAAVKGSIPLLDFLEEERPQTLQQVLHETLAGAFPWYAYEKLYLMEVVPEIAPEESADASTEEEAGQTEQTGTDSQEVITPDSELQAGMMQENAAAGEAGLQGEQQPQTEEGAQEQQEPQTETGEQISLEERIQAALADPWVLAQGKGRAVPDFAQVLQNYAGWETEQLLHTFYTVDSTTDAAKAGISAEKFVGFSGASSIKGQSGYQILIYHTHSREKYADSAAYPDENGVVGAGEFLARLLEEEYGYRVLHLTQSFDTPNRDYAYGNALPVLEQVLQEHPEIQVVIDLHRDEVDESVRLVTEVEGKPVARYMFFNGLSYTRGVGKLENLPNPSLQENLAFSFQMQAASEAVYPGNTRKIYLKGYRYNMHLRPCSLLIELGAQNTTESEAWNACVLLAKVLDTVLCYHTR